MKRKLLYFITVIALAIFALSMTACGNNDEPAPTPTPAPQEEAVQDDEPDVYEPADENGDEEVTTGDMTDAERRQSLSGELTVWARGWSHWGLTGGAPDQPYFEYFREQFPNVVINEVINRDWHYLTGAIAAGDAPDAFFWEGEPPRVFRNMVEQGFVAPLDNFIANTPGFADQFLPGMLEMHRFDGNIYGLPIDVMPNAIILNLDVFDLRNVPHPNNSWTIDDMVQLAGQLTNKNDPTSPTVGVVRNIEEQDYVRMLNFFLQAHGVQGYTLVDGQRVSNLADDAGAIAAIQQYIEVQGNNFANTFSHDERVALGLDTSVWNIDWAAGVGAMFVGAGPWGMYINQDTREPLFNQTVMPPPTGPGGRGNYVAIIGMSIFAGSQNQELAWEYLQAMTSRDFREGAWTTNDAGERVYPLRFDENSYRFGWGLPAFQVDESRLTGHFRDWFLGFQAAALHPNVTVMYPPVLLDVTRDVESGARQLVDALREYDDFVNANNLIADR